ncbi:MAG: hypothetical protein U9O06_08555 [Euryarchaeota archaeon]|nr:hypothetical protein [Euryarchaeota archaeon]
MSWYAVESVDEAIDTTRSFLFPIEPGRWLRLALIAFFVGVGGSGASILSNTASLPANMPAEPTPQQPAPVPSELSLETLPIDPLLIAAIIGGVVILGLGLTLISETLRLVLYDALRTDTVRIRGPARRRFGQAVRLFGFKLTVSVVFVLPFVVLGAVIALDTVFLGGPALLVGGAVLAVCLVLWFVGYLIISRVTNEFVTPVMVRTDSGVLSAWRRFWPVVRNDLAQFGVYVVVHFLLLLAISIGQTILAAIVFGIIGTVGALGGLLVVLGVFGGLNAALASTVGVIALGAIVLLTVVVATVCYLPIKIVVLTYVFSYELSVLGAADEELRLLPVDDDTETTANPN